MAKKNKTQSFEDQSLEGENIDFKMYSEIKRSQTLEKQISHLSSRIEEELKSNASQRLRIRGLQHDIAMQKRHLKQIQQSWSYKIALAVTAPFSHLAYLLRPLSHNESILAQSFSIIRTIAKHPVLLFRHLSWKNLNTLWVAIRSRESLHDIGQNLQALLENSFSTGESSSPNRVGVRSQIHIDHCFIFQQNIEIQGWVVTDLKVKKLSVSISGKILGNLKTGYLRPNVAATFGNYRYSRNTGFQFNGRYETRNKTEEVLIRIIYEGGQFQEYLVPCTVETIESQYSKYLKKKKSSSRARIKSQPSYSIYIINSGNNLAYLERSLLSIESQTYENWDLTILNSSRNAEIRSFLHATIDRKIRNHQSDDENIYRSLSHLLPDSLGSHVLFLQANTQLAPECLFEISIAIDRSTSESSQGKIFFFDEDEMDDQLQRMHPRFKPGFNPDFLTTFNYIGNTVVVEKNCGDSQNWIDCELESDCIYDLLLRAADAKLRFIHLPTVLAHNFNVLSEQAPSTPSGYKALSQYLIRNCIAGEILPGLTESTFRLKRSIVKKEKISIIIPFNDKVSLLKACISSILNKTDYPNYEILLISNNSHHPETIDYLQSIVKKHALIRYFEFNVPFNYSRINNWAVKKCQGKYLLFLNNDTSVINQNWLSCMVEHIQREEVGAVGAKLLYPDDTVQHTGVVLNLSGLADHVHKNIYDWENGYMDRANSIQNVTACTAACLLVKKKLFDDLGGFDEINLKIAFNDVDLCVKIREAGYLIVYTPFAKLYHYESKSRGTDNTTEKQKRTAREVKFFRRKWKHILRKGDEYYNPNLTLKRKDSSLNI